MTEEQILEKLQEIQDAQVQTKDAMRVLSETLAAHVRQNIETFHEVREYIGDQMSYRLFRQNLEENNLQLELAKKALELEYAEKRFAALEKEHLEGTEETDRLKLEYEKQKLEIEALRKSHDLLQGARNSTKDKMKTVANQPNPFHQKMKETFILTGIGTLTAASVGGVIAFFVFFIRFYIMNNP